MMEFMKGKKILIGISGGIAAYKTAELIRLFVKLGAEVKCVMTNNALKFISELTIQTLSKNRVYTDVFQSVGEVSTDHISHADWADFMVVAPATANIIAKFASGIADDALSTTFLAFNKPIFIAPAMNSNMYNNKIVQRNINELNDFGIHVIYPNSGELACGVTGDGRMKEPIEIVDFINDFFS